MVRLGAHVSVAGGLENGPANGVAIGCEAIQIFSKNQRQWNAKPITEEQAQLYRDAYRDSRLGGQVVHGSYLINLGQPDEKLWKNAVQAFVDEIQRCDQLGIPGLVFHPGAHMGLGDARGVERIAQAVGKALDATSGAKVDLLFEVMAGQGTVVGYKLEHVRDVMRAVGSSKRFGTCFDTCHLHAAGYDMTTKRLFDGTDHVGYDAVMKEAHHLIGLDRVRAFHLNDSKGPLGCRVDRHERIGAGTMGLAPFWHVVNDARFKDTVAVLETPPGDDLHYARDLFVLKGLRNYKEAPSKAQAKTLAGNADAMAKKLFKALTKQAAAEKKAAKEAKREAVAVR